MKNDANIFNHSFICTSLIKYINKTSITTQMKPNYLRCEIGKRCVAKTTDNRVFKKYTFVKAFSSKVSVAYYLYKNGGMTCERMVEFLDVFINRFKITLL